MLNQPLLSEAWMHVSFPAGEKKKMFFLNFFCGEINIPFPLVPAKNNLSDFGELDKCGDLWEEKAGGDKAAGWVCVCSVSSCFLGPLLALLPLAAVLALC